MSPEQQVLHVIARYVRAVDHRRGDDMAALFLPDAKVSIYQRYTGAPEASPGPHLIGELVGSVAIGGAVSGMMPPHGSLGWSHHVTSNAIVHVDGASATLDTQFMMFEVHGAGRPRDGWPAGAFGAQGAIVPREAGYYRTSLRRVDGDWLIAHHEITHDLPFAIPGY